MASNNPMFDKIEEIKKCLTGYELRKLIAEALTLSAQGMTEALAAQITAAQTALTNLQQAIAAGNVDMIADDVEKLKESSNAIASEPPGYEYKLTPNNMTVNAGATTKISSDLILKKGKYIATPNGRCAIEKYSAHFHIKDSGGKTLLSADRCMAISGVIEATTENYTIALYCSSWPDGDTTINFTKANLYSNIKLVRLK